MRHRVHKLEMGMASEQVKLEQFINNLAGEIISIIPNVAKTSLFQIYGFARKVNFLFVVEKL